MEKLDLFRTLGEVDDDILEDAEEFLNRMPDKRPTPAWVKWGSLAACAAVALTGVFFFRRPNCTLPVASASVPPAVQTDSASVPPVVQTDSATDRPTVDAPAVEPAEETARSFAKLNPNKLTEAPTQNTAALFALVSEDFVPMTREELLGYYGVALPVEELFPQLSNLGPGEGNGSGIYRRADGTPYFDTNTFAFESAYGGAGVYIALDKAFHLPVSPWKLLGDELRFTAVNGWELALFCYVDEEGNLYYCTEFRQNGVNFRVTGKNMGELEFAALLEALLEPREEDFAPGAVRTFRGMYGGGIGHQFLGTRNPDGSTTVEESWTGPLFLDLDDGGEYSSLCIELTPEQAAQLAELDLGDQVTVRFTGEPATVGTVWNQQLVSIERK